MTSFKWNQGAAAQTMPVYDDGTTNTLPADSHQPAVLTPWDSQSKRIFAEDGVSPTLNSGSREGGNIQPTVLTFAQNTRDEVRVQGDGTVVGSLSAQPGMKQTTYVLQSDGSTSINSHGNGYSEDEVGYTLNNIDRQSVVYCTASGQANAEVMEEQSPTLNCLHEQPIVIDRAAFNQGANAAYPPPRGADGRDGRARCEGAPRCSASNGEDIVSALCARDWKGVGGQYVTDGKVVCHPATL